MAAEGLAASPVGEVLVEESVAGWKEFELEVMRDGADNAIVVCSIENVDPMGVHTGDSVTVAPAHDAHRPRIPGDADAALRVHPRRGRRHRGLERPVRRGPGDGRQVLIEMNPRVSRSSALASKATGFPIAKIAALLAVGYRLDEIRNDITGRDAGRVRADPGLRGRQGAAVGVREVPLRRPGAGDHHEVRGRGHGHRADLRRGAGQGFPGTGASGVRTGHRPPGVVRARGPVEADGEPSAARVIGRWPPATRWRRSPRRARIDPWFVDQLGARSPKRPRSLRGRSLGLAHGGGAAGRETVRAVRRSHRQAHRLLGGATSGRPAAARRDPRVQDRRHVRRASSPREPRTTTRPTRTRPRSTRRSSPGW